MKDEYIYGAGSTWTLNSAYGKNSIAPDVGVMMLTKAQAEERARYEAKKLDEEEERLAARLQEWNTFLKAKCAELGPNGFHVTLKNDCETETLDVAIIFKIPGGKNSITMGWWTVEPGSSVQPAIVSDHRRFYFYAKTRDTGSEWDGTGESDSFENWVVDSAFANPGTEPVLGRGRKSVSFFRRRSTPGSDFVVTFTESKPALKVVPISPAVTEKKTSKSGTRTLLAIAAASALLGAGVYLDKTEAGRKTFDKLFGGDH